MRRELQRINQSGSFILAKHIAEAIRSPLKAIFLPFTFTMKTLEVIRGKKGGISMPESQEYSFQLKKKDNNRALYSFLPHKRRIRHFTRLLAIAKSLKRSDCFRYRTGLLTTMPTLRFWLMKE